MNGFVDLLAVTRDAESVWAADAAIRAEFVSKDVYLAFRRAEAKGLGGSRVGAMRATAGAQAAVASSTATGAAETTDAEAEWSGSASIRAEFADNKAAYLALRRAEGRNQVRVIAPGAAHLGADTRAAPVPKHLEAGSPDLAARQAVVRQENIGRQFAGLAPLAIPQD